MPRPLYLYEHVDIVGQGAYAYMEHLKADPVEEMPGMNRLQGTFYTIGMTGRWPEVINIWDIPGSWDGWRANIDRLNLKRRKAFYEDWWDEAYKWRTGGFDRFCAGVPGSPTTEEIRARGIKGTLFLHELTQVRPGAALDYLAATVAERVPLMAEYGHIATGLYEVQFCDTEVVTIWATDVASHTRLQKAYDAARGLTDDAEGDPRLVAWRRRAREYATRWREELMTPRPGTVYGPDSYD
jgi:hypothetical protein